MDGCCLTDMHFCHIECFVSKRIIGDTDYVELTVWGDNKLVFSMRVFGPNLIFINE
jgi:hypothetical protein